MKVKLATEDWEFEQIHNLNYETFVEEIPQHQKNTRRALVDKFHDTNQYIIVIHKKEVIGMMAINNHRPFSLDGKLPEIEKYLPPFEHAFEIRLLAVKKNHRGNRVFFLIFSKLKELLSGIHVDIGLISGILSQISMYEKIGFKPFGPLVGTAEAPYQPMYITWDAYNRYIKLIEPKLKTVSL